MVTKGQRLGRTIRKKENGVEFSFKESFSKVLRKTQNTAKSASDTRRIHIFKIHAIWIEKKSDYNSPIYHIIIPSDPIG